MYFISFKVDEDWENIDLIFYRSDNKNGEIKLTSSYKKYVYLKTYQPSTKIYVVLNHS